MAAAGNGQSHLVRYLVTCGANINAQDKAGWTALMLAARAGRIDVVMPCDVVFCEWSVGYASV